MVGLLNNPISQGLHALTLVLNLIYTSLFSSLVLMRTKSSIEDLYARTAYSVLVLKFVMLYIIAF